MVDIKWHDFRVLSHNSGFFFSNLVHTFSKRNWKSVFRIICIKRSIVLVVFIYWQARILTFLIIRKLKTYSGTHWEGNENQNHMLDNITAHGSNSTTNIARQKRLIRQEMNTTGLLARSRTNIDIFWEWKTLDLYMKRYTYEYVGITCIWKQWTILRKCTNLIAALKN